MRKSSYSDEDLRVAVSSSTSMAQVLRCLGLIPAGGNYQATKAKINRLGLTTSHWLGQGYRKGSTTPVYEKPLAQLLVRGLLTSTVNLKRRLLKEGLLANLCSICGVSEWLGKPLLLHLDHINGDHLDNRLENLRVLCPNCDSQTSTYCGKNIGRSTRWQHGGKADALVLKTGVEKREGSTPSVATNRSDSFCQCGAKIGRGSKTCLRCRPHGTRKVKGSWPSDDELRILVWSKSTVKVALEVGVSSSMIKKRCKKVGIPTPPPGYWSKFRGPS